MFGLDDLTFYTAVIGGGAVLGEAGNIFIKSIRAKTDKIATSEFGTIKTLSGLLGNNGLKISKNIQLSLKTCFEGICIIGPTGSGKTSTQFIPNLLSNDLPDCSLMIADPKGEQFKLTAWYQSNVCGRQPILFAPLQPQNSFKYNLLANCENSSEVIQLASNLLLNGSLATEIATGKKSGGSEWIDMLHHYLQQAFYTAGNMVDL